MHARGHAKFACIQHNSEISDQQEIGWVQFQELPQHSRTRLATDHTDRETSLLAICEYVMHTVEATKARK
jgi:hypothetical protein